MRPRRSYGHTVTEKEKGDLPVTGGEGQRYHRNPSTAGITTTTLRKKRDDPQRNPAGGGHH